MSGAMVMDEFDGLLAGVLRERVAAEAPAGMGQRLKARLAQEEGIERRVAGMFGFAERVVVRRSAASTWFAVGAHAAALLVVLGVASTRVLVHERGVTLATKIDAPPPVSMQRRAAIGGGGGQHDVAPVSKGHLPKFAESQIVAPKAPPTIAPKLAVEPTLVMQPDLKMANNAMPNIGAPNSSLSGVSLGDGMGSGLGGGKGAGFGPGAGGNMGGGIFHVGGAISSPVVIHAVDPEFSEEARKAKFSGNIEVYLWVDEQGNPSHVRVVRGVGMGMDERVLAAVRQYKFKPAMKDGKPVKVDLYIDVDCQIF